jgi:hypothetical protein
VISRLVIAQRGIFAVASTNPVRASAGKRSKRRWAKTDPSKRPVYPFPRSMSLLSTATRASSPMRPGRIALASSPIENAEKTRRKAGCCPAGSAWLITVRQDQARITTESRLRARATAIQVHET